MTKNIYKASSDYEFFKSVFFKFLCLGAIGYLYFQYDENPKLIIILSLFCFVFFLLIGNDEILINSEKIIQRDTSIASILLKNRDVSYSLSEIKSATIPNKPDSDFSELSFAGLLVAFLPRPGLRHRDSSHPIILELKNGQIITIFTSLGETKRKKIVEVVNSLV